LLKNTKKNKEFEIPYEKFCLMSTTGKGQVGGPHKGHNMSYQQSQVEWYGKANEIGGLPNGQELDFVLAKIGMIGQETGRYPSRWIHAGSGGKDGRFENIKGLVDK
jgi:hypothetical protein